MSSRNNVSIRIEHIENIIGAAQNADTRAAELEAIAKHPANQEAIAFIRRRLAIIVMEARALRQQGTQKEE